MGHEVSTKCLLSRKESRRRSVEVPSPPTANSAARAFNSGHRVSSLYDGAMKSKTDVLSSGSRDR